MSKSIYRRRRFVWYIGMLGALLLPVPAVQALGLGEVEVYSNLNEPLDARIVIRASETEQDHIRIRYSSPEDFVRAGLR